MPHEWTEAVIVPFHIKGSRIEYDNYRRISLLSVVGRSMQELSVVD